MKVTLIGATGFVGSAVLSELLQRGHQVTVLARTPAKVPAQPGVTVVQGSALNAADVQAAAQGQDAVVSAYNPGWTEPDLYNQFLQGSRTIVEGVRASGTRRLLVVGGAGSLFVAPGVQLVDTPEFPAEWKNGALAARDALNELRWPQQPAQHPADARDAAVEHDKKGRCRANECTAQQGRPGREVVPVNRHVLAPVSGWGQYRRYNKPRISSTSALATL